MARTGNNALVPALGVYPMTSDPTFGTDVTEVANDVAVLLSTYPASPAELPADDNWPGRVLPLQTGGLYLWTGTGWVPLTTQSCLASVAGSLNSGTTGDAATSGSNFVSDPTVASVGTNAIIIGRTGMYNVSASINWASNSNGSRVITATRNNAGMSPALGDRRPANNVSLQSFSNPRRLSTGDVIRLSIVQDSGATLSYSGQMAVQWVHA